MIDPSTEQAFTQIAIGSAADVDHAVAAARRAFDSFSMTTRDERLVLLRRILDAYEARMDDLAAAISREMGAPIGFARDSQAWIGAAHLAQMIETLESFEFESLSGGMLISREPVGVVGLITPWNWPMNQIVCKVAPAIAAGCCCVLKPSEIAPLSGIIFAEILEAAEVPAGVFNLVQGDGTGVGEAIARHPGIDMVSFTGSTRAGVIVARLAADTVKRVHQELGGKSPNLILADADLEQAVTRGVAACFGNSGQSCDAPTRMLVPRARHEEALGHARRAAESFVTGDPLAASTMLGPVVSEVHFEKIQRLIRSGIEEGAALVTGGMGRPDGLDRGYYIRPTVFGHVKPDMTIAREEIFGPVLSILSYDSEADAIAIANDTPYGLAAYIQSGDLAHARTVARRIRAGNVLINNPDWSTAAPFGGFKQSGNGREYGEFGLADFLRDQGDARLWPGARRPRLSGPSPLYARDVARVVAPALAGEARVETVVIGAGFTGLSAALHLAEAGRSVAVLDGHEPGWGASGRNGGQVNPGLKPDPDEVARQIGGERGERLMQAAWNAPDLVFSLVARHGIDCAAVRGGTLRAATSRRDIAGLQRLAAQCGSPGTEASLLDAGETAARTGTRRYLAALLDRRGGQVNPFAYANGLARVAQGAGARIHAQSRALRLERRGNGWQVTTAAAR